MHHDHVDEECDLLKIKYRKWEGSTNEKTELHVSHVPFETESKIPHTQEIPSNCVLCPVKSISKTTGTEIDTIMWCIYHV